MSAQVDLVTLNDGYKIPVLGLGTWQGRDDPNKVENAVKIAIDEGYRHFDCASIYDNEEYIGKAIKAKIQKSVIKREDLFIVTKLWNNEHQEKSVVPACKRSLKKLSLSYVDLYLIHWPFSYQHEVDFLETWRGMEQCRKLGLARSIGVSNFNSNQLTKLLSSAVTKPAVNQIEVHINLNQRRLREFCMDKNIAVTAYSPFGAPGRCSLFQPPGANVDLNVMEVTAIGKKYGKTNAQVALRYLIDIGTIPIPKSSLRNHLRENINVFDFKLTPEEISTIDTLDTGFRTCPAKQHENWREYPFKTELE